VPVQTLCTRCGTHTVQERFPLRCDSCGGLDIRIVKGEELTVESLEVSDERPILEEVT
jgi:Zn finger protein HypA/HybF involved in hydrogenase expression